MFLDEEKYINYHCDQWKSDKETNMMPETYSVGELRDYVNQWIRTLEMNKKNIYEVPVFVVDEHEQHRQFCIRRDFIGIKQNVGWVVGLCPQLSGKYTDELRYVAPDKRPYEYNEGEYWNSRGIGDGKDLSGFVVSKKAGERLLNMVRIVLDKQETDSWLDYREDEPNWIQFKFKPTEFDLAELERLAKENGDVVDFNVLRKSKINNPDKN